MPHRALLMHDVLLEIFCKFRPTWMTENRHTLFNLALVCKMFSVHALNLLWEELHDVRPALELLPSFEAVLLDDEDEHEHTDYWRLDCFAYRLRDAITPADLVSLRRYTRRVRKLHVASGKLPELRVSVLACLANLNHGPLFPSLRRLEWDQTLYSDPTLQFLVSPSLRHLSITALTTANKCMNPVEDRDFTTLMHAVSAGAPSLEEISICAVCHPLCLVPLLNGQHLRKVDVLVPAVFGPVMDKLAILPSLIELNVSLQVGHRDMGNTSGFVALQTLAITGQALDLTCFLVTVSSPFLHLLQINGLEQVPSYPEEWRSLIIATLPRFESTLRSFVFVPGSMWKSHDQEHVLLPLFYIIRPILIARYLEEVDLTFSQSFRTTDRDIIDMAAAWPNLRSFYLSYPNSGPQGPPLSPRILLEIARLCPYLVHLKLPPVDLRSQSLDEVTPAAGHRPPQTKLNFLHVSYRPTPAAVPMNPSQVADFIDSLFPNIDVEHALDSYLELYWDLEYAHRDPYRDESAFKRFEWDPTAPVWMTVLERLQDVQKRRTSSMVSRAAG